MIASRSRSMSFTTSPESLALSMNPAAVPFANSSCDRLPISANVLKRVLARAGRASDLQAYLVNSALRFVSSRSPSIVDVVMACLSLSSWGLRFSIFSLTSLNSCHRPHQLCTTSRLLAQYLVMFDECIHTAEGGLDRGKPIGGLCRNIEENLDAIYDSLLLC